jgi:heat shock protein HslJ
MMIVVAVALLAGSCGRGDGGGASTSSDRELTGRTFLSESVTEHGRARELVDSTRIFLDFTTDGQISANAGCNHLFGEVSIDDDRLEVGLMGGTEMGCDPALHAQDEWLMAFLQNSPAWSLDGDRLTLTTADTEIVLLNREVADPDRPLEGTRWLVDTVISGEAASSMWAGTEGSAWLLIEGEQFTASSGCRDFEGGVERGDEFLQFTDTVQTDPACPAELREVDEAMQAIFAAEAEYVVEAARLTLAGPDGVGLGLHADE